jgi:hypothetical protein
VDHNDVKVVAVEHMMSDLAIVVAHDYAPNFLTTAMMTTNAKAPSIIKVTAIRTHFRILLSCFV